MLIRGIHKGDYDEIVRVLDRWWGGPGGDRAHPIFFYELGKYALIAEEGDQLIGFLLGLVADTEPPTGYVHLVGIHPSWRRRGVGLSLYQTFADRCRETGVGQLKSITTVGNEASLRFHAALGFEIREDPDYAGHGRARVVFTKTLSGEATP